jgi:hypothetical protein
MVGLSGPTGVALIIGRPEAAEELFLTKNKYFDKHPRSSQQFQRVIGDSILFSPSDMKWQ